MPDFANSPKWVSHAYKTKRDFIERHAILALPRVQANIEFLDAAIAEIEAEAVEKHRQDLEAFPPVNELDFYRDLLKRKGFDTALQVAIAEKASRPIFDFLGGRRKVA